MRIASPCRNGGLRQAQIRKPRSRRQIHADRRLLERNLHDGPQLCLSAHRLALLRHHRLLRGMPRRAAPADCRTGIRHCRRRLQTLARALPPLDGRRLPGRSHRGDLLPQRHLQRLGRICLHGNPGPLLRLGLLSRVGVDALRPDYPYNHRRQPLCPATEQHEALPRLLVDFTGRLHHARHHRQQRHGHGFADVLHSGLHLLEPRRLRRNPGH